MRIVILMLDENIQGREIVKQLFKNAIKINAILAEKGSRISKSSKNYLLNNYYNPPKINELVINREVPLYFTSNHNSNSSQNILKYLKPDIVILGGARLLKKCIIDIPKIGILNSHPGLLPDYRGMDVVAWSIYNDDPVGATCHFIDEGADTGPILIRKKLNYKRYNSLLEIRIENMKLCSKIMAEAVIGIRDKKIKPIKQKKEEGKKYFQMPNAKLRAVEGKLKL